MPSAPSKEYLLRKRRAAGTTGEASSLLPYCPHAPSPKQKLGLDCEAFELPYGGAAGGGKTDFVLMDAVRFVDRSNYRAIIFRRTYRELAAVGGLIERSKEWWNGIASWHGGDAVWTFPSGAKIGFKHMQHEDDKYQLQSIEIHRAYLEECNQFTESQARYVLSRIRKNVGDPIPLAARYTTNPGGYRWVKDFVTACLEDPEGEAAEGRVFIQAKLEDNAAIDQDEYRRALDRLDPVTRAQLLLGDWNVGIEGNMFREASFNVIDELPIMARKNGRWLRYWDMAASERKPGRDPDYSAGVLMVAHEGNFYVVECAHFQLEPAEGDTVVVNTARNDGTRVSVRMEQEPGSSGKRVASYFADRLVGYDFAASPSTGSKVDRARPWSAAVAQGRVYLVRGRYVSEFIAEHVGFPLGPHDDIVDAAAGAFNGLASGQLVGQASTIERRRGSRELRKGF